MFSKSYLDKGFCKMNILSDSLDVNICIILQDNRVHIGPKIEMRVVTLGLDDSGKTSILFKLKQNEFITTIPTIGKFFLLVKY